MDSLSWDDDRIIVLISLVVILILIMSLTLILFYYLSRRKIIQKELEQKNQKIEFQKHNQKSTILAQEKERERIAKDLHDAISSKLNVISLTSHMLLEVEDNSESIKGLKHILDVTNATLENARKIAHDLLPPTLDQFGLKIALEELFEDFVCTNRMSIQSDLIDVKALDPKSELHIFRITQELLSNSVKHGLSNAIEVCLYATENYLVLYYRDNGIGFDPKRLDRSKGIGLENIKSRVSLLNGELSIYSILKKGSCFKIRMKLYEKD